MNCGRCGHELDVDEKWNGDTEFHCPICGIVKGTSQKAPREEPIPGLAGAALFLGGSAVTELERLSEISPTIHKAPL